MHKRRLFIKNLLAVSCSLGFSKVLYASSSSLKEVNIATQQYPWQSFFKREGANWSDSLNQSLKQLTSSGIKGLEPILNSVEGIEEFKTLLLKHQIKTDSLYVNSLLHESEKAEESINQILKLAEAVKSLGIKIIVTNPSPIRWGGQVHKTDSQLKTQAHALETLGKKLHQKGLILAYHNHDIEMHKSAREFHHMMIGTDANYVQLCLDAHWIYRGSGNSQVALFDIVNLYKDRIVELHLRQSQNGIWTETFCPGDIDYQHLADFLLSNNIKPHLVLEQAVEKESPFTMNAVEAHKKSLTYAQIVFRNFT